MLAEGIDQRELVLLLWCNPFSAESSSSEWHYNSVHYYNKTLIRQHLIRHNHDYLPSQLPTDIVYFKEPISINWMSYVCSPFAARIAELQPSKFRIRLWLNGRQKEVKKPTAIPKAPTQTSHEIILLASKYPLWIPLVPNKEMASLPINGSSASKSWHPHSLTLFFLPGPNPKNAQISSAEYEAANASSAHPLFTIPLPVSLVGSLPFLFLAMKPS